MLTGSPGWANGGRGANYAPTRPCDFAAFAAAAAKRYPAVHHWMIWGEPTRMPNFVPFVAQSEKAHGRPLTTRQQQAPHRYARLLDASYGALKAASSKNLVIGGNTYTTGDIPPVAWVQNLKLPNGKPPRMDLYGHNPFSYRHPSLKNPQSSTGHRRLLRPRPLPEGASTAISGARATSASDSSCRSSRSPPTARTRSSTST